jgi:hypothetical protein
MYLDLGNLYLLFYLSKNLKSFVQGFNDLGEMLPFQGGTNEQVVYKLYQQLNSEKKQEYLKVYWYTAKDQIKPLNAALKKRNCHGMH